MNAFLLVLCHHDRFFNLLYVHLRCHCAFARVVLAPRRALPSCLTRVTPIQLSHFGKRPFLIRESSPACSSRPSEDPAVEGVSGPLRGGGDLTLHLVPRAQRKTGHRFLLKQGGTCSGRRKPVFMLPKAAAPVGLAGRSLVRLTHTCAPPGMILSLHSWAEWGFRAKGSVARVVPLHPSTTLFSFLMF